MAVCRLVEKGLRPGKCMVYCAGRWEPACKVTLKWVNGIPYRLINSYAHKPPELYLSIYQSGCNWSCMKCHSWRFTRYVSGYWMSPHSIAKIAEDYVKTSGEAFYREPRERATSWHAHQLCRSCGSCIMMGRRAKYCPGKLKPTQLKPLDGFIGWGPARNIVSFTGGDLACQPEFYIEATKEVKSLNMDLWVLFETNGYGLIPDTLDRFRDAGMDAFWLDIKAYYDDVHRRLTGATNKWVLELPAEIIDRGFVLEVSTVYIPGMVEEDQIERIAKLLAQVNKNIPYSIIAFIPEYKLREISSPTFKRMLEAYLRAKDAGLRNVRLGNIGLFVKNEEQYEYLLKIGAI